MAARQWASDPVPETEATEMNSTIINFIIFTFAFITFTCHAIMPIIPLQFIYQSSSSIRSLNRCLSNSGSECSSDFVMVWFEVISCFTWKIMSSCLVLYFPFPVFVFFLPFFPLHLHFIQYLVHGCVQNRLLRYSSYQVWCQAEYVVRSNCIVCRFYQRETYPDVYHIGYNLWVYEGSLLHIPNHPKMRLMDDSIKRNSHLKNV